MGVYAPPSDCKGSGFARAKDGTCVDRNKPSEYARFLANKLDVPTDVDVKLFETNGKSTNRLRELMRFSAIYETGFFMPKYTLIDDGIAMEASNWRRLLEKQEKRIKIPKCQNTAPTPRR